MPRRPTKGQAWAAKVRADYELNPSQDATVDVIADITDMLTRTDLDPSERRQQQAVLLRAHSLLALPDEDGTEGGKHLSASQRASRAARARWADRTGTDA
jgi:hypothetical protein